MLTLQTSSDIIKLVFDNIQLLITAVITVGKGGLNMNKINKAIVSVKNFWKETFKSRLVAICFSIIFLTFLLQNVRKTVILLIFIMLCTFVLALYRILDDYKIQNLINEGRTYKAFMVCYTILVLMNAIKSFGILFWTISILASIILWFDIDPKKVWELVKNKISKN